MSRRTFLPVAGLGVASAGLGVLATTKPLLEIPASWWDGVGRQQAAGAQLMLDQSSGSDVPLAWALALVTLAGWGVLLVTRGRVRRVLTAVTALAALGVVAAVGFGWFAARDDRRGDVAHLVGRQAAEVPVQPTGWLWIGLLAGVATTAAAVVAVRQIGSWPEMGSRYDAPGDKSGPSRPAPESPLDYWKAIDEGRDPTL